MIQTPHLIRFDDGAFRWSIVEFDSNRDEIFLTYCADRIHGPKITRDGMRPPYMEHVSSKVPGETTTHQLGQRVGSWLIQKHLVQIDRKMIIDEIKKMIYLYESAWSDILSEPKDQGRLKDALDAININLGISSVFTEIEPNDTIKVNLDEKPHHLFLNTREKKAFLVAENAEQCQTMDINDDIPKESEEDIKKYINDKFKLAQEKVANIKVIDRDKAKAIKIESTYKELQFLFFDADKKKTFLVTENAEQCQTTDINDEEILKEDAESIKKYINDKSKSDSEKVAQILNLKKIDLIKVDINQQSHIIFIDQDENKAFSVTENNRMCLTLDICGVDLSKEDNFRKFLQDKFNSAIGELKWCKAIKVESESIDKRSHFLFLSTKGEKGTGLGLATVQRIAESFGGAVKFETEKSKGTSFFVFFPVKEKQNK